MAVLQSNEQELRYLKRNNLKEEAKIVAGYYRDIIRSYGLDVNYYVHNTFEFEGFKGIVDQNTKLRYAYGYDVKPDYNISAEMLAYMEVDGDVLALNNMGLVPNSDVNFYFDKIDFACALASKLGQYKECKIDQTKVVCEVPNPDDTCAFPYKLDLGDCENFFCEMLSGKMDVVVDGYEYDVEKTVVCNPYEHTELVDMFPQNPDLYKAFMHRYQNNEFLEIALFLTFTVSKVLVGFDAAGSKVFKNVLHGHTHGGVLFYDLSKVGKYMDLIHPEVGDIVTIDFPDENNREQYEITQAFDKQLTQDGISPLLHTYIWKCRARRYINQYEKMEDNEANDRLEEKTRYEQAKENEVIKKILYYPDQEDAAYGGDDPTDVDYDAKKIDPAEGADYDFIDDGTNIDLLKFACGSRLATTGYELLFIAKSGKVTKLTTEKYDLPLSKAVQQTGLKNLKASDSEVMYVNMLGEYYRIVHDDLVEENSIPYQLDNMYEKTYEVGKMNKNGDNFYKFSNTKTYLFADSENLFCKLDSNKKIYKLV